MNPRIAAALEFIPFAGKPAIDLKTLKTDGKALAKRVGTITVVAITALALCAAFFQAISLMAGIIIIPAVVLITELVRSSRAATTEAVKLYIEKEATPVEAADILRTNEAAARLLVKKTENLNKKSTMGETLLHDLKEEKIAEILIGGGARVDIKVDFGAPQTALEEAISEKREKILKIFFKSSSASFKSQDQERIWKAVKTAETVALLHQNKYPLNKVGETTPLHIVAMEGRPDIVAKLLDLGADGIGTDAQGNTPFHVIHTASTIPALAKKVDLNKPNKEGVSPLFYHLHQKSDKNKTVDHLPIALALIRQGASLQEKYDKETPLTYAIKQGYTHFWGQIVDAMLDKKADPKAPNEAGETPLAIATKLAKKQPEYAPLVKKLTL